MGLDLSFEIPLRQTKLMLRVAIALIIAIILGGAIVYLLTD
jgi:hypothetical protein